MDAKKLGKFIAELRKEKGMTQSQLAAMINVTDKAVSRWERGVGLPDVTVIEPLAEALNVKIAELMKGRKMTSSELIEENDSECLREMMEEVKKDTRMITWNYAILIIVVLLMTIYLQYGWRNPKEIYGGALTSFFWGGMAIVIPWFSFWAKKYQPIFMIGSFFCCLQAVLLECHFIYHKVYINDLSAVMDCAGLPEFTVRFYGGLTLTINLVVYVLADSEHRKSLVQFLMDMIDCIHRGILWIMRKF